MSKIEKFQFLIALPISNERYTHSNNKKTETWETPCLCTLYLYMLYFNLHLFLFGLQQTS